MINDRYFLLYACCIPVKGAKNSIICDLQRDEYIQVPQVLFYILTRFSKKRISWIKKYFENQHDTAIDDYFTSLEISQYGFFTDEPRNFPDIDINSFNQHQEITNAIIDFTRSSTHDLQYLVNQLSALHCEALELRFFEPITLQKLSSNLSAARNSTLRSIEATICYTPEITVDSILKLQSANPRLKKVIVHSALQNKLYEDSNLVIYLTVDVIGSENCCGVVSPWYFISKIENFTEAKRYNSCLNKKIGIDKDGFIKNCPSMKESFGNISDTALKSVLNNSNFKKVWSINKDKVAVCKDCEFRYICQDCRAYVDNPLDVYSKPSKCAYDPYKGIWN